MCLKMPSFLPCPFSLSRTRKCRTFVVPFAYAKAVGVPRGAVQRSQQAQDTSKQLSSNFLLHSMPHGVPVPISEPQRKTDTPHHRRLPCGSARISLPTARALNLACSIVPNSLRCTLPLCAGEKRKCRHCLCGSCCPFSLLAPLLAATKSPTTRHAPACSRPSREEKSNCSARRRLVPFCPFLLSSKKQIATTHTENNAQTNKRIRCVEPLFPASTAPASNKNQGQPNKGNKFPLRPTRQISANATAVPSSDDACAARFTAD
ncbi:hypothetical protein TvY486_0002230 [Trypanosoma vivax Y486]|uniref:Uncharacterized protein n=1 Tax=Trypanosoma vivax (strain Y486) TaxID=1055687 RepID=F9WQ83_TRYVY|nr:hypothetical protein TvY486_0002230 [Trypanosoma vivax Y486]|eukprot:CCD19710.1 hypothetical protein TvY486_0002230 [Trypanosoma vivax Y486]